MVQSTDFFSNSPIKVSMLGEFRIEADDKYIRDGMARTRQLWRLLGYLITFRHKSISQEELMEVLWPQDNIENPVNALKNLVYRARTMLAENQLPFAKKMIVYSRGSYHWNNTLPCSVDVEIFERLSKQANSTMLSASERMQFYRQALSLYNGDFLAGFGYESWVTPLASYYRSMYFKNVYALLEMLLEQERYAEAESICKKALMIDQLEEKAHRYLILSMLRQGRQSQALEHYNFVTDLFFRELGVKPSASMQELYQDLIKSMHTCEADILAIKEELREPDEISGAFYCEYEVFKTLYRLEARAASRTGETVFIGLLTVSGPRGKKLDLKTQNRIMDTVYDVIYSGLRKGDVFARFSPTQYVLLLPTVTYENGVAVMDRLIRTYKQHHRNRTVELVARVQPLDPIELPKL